MLKMLQQLKISGLLSKNKQNEQNPLIINTAYRKMIDII